MNIEKIKKEKKIEELIKLGIVNIDKPSDCTSFDVANYVRKLLGLNKTGHLGTLDPNVTGVLPICLEKTCRIQEFLMHQDKTYIGKMKLHKDITKEELEKEMKKFIGEINQLPPRISRVKREYRKRKIMKFEILSFDKREAEFISEVQAGTYIRKLIDDLGKNIGGAQMIELRRIKAGLFSDKDKEFVSIEKFKEAVEDYKNGKEEKLRKIIIPAEIISKLLPSISIDEKYTYNIKNGSPIFEEMIENKKDLEIINSKEPFLVLIKGNLMEIAKFTDRFENKKILAKPEAVMD